MRSREFTPMSRLKGLVGNIVLVVNLPGMESHAGPGTDYVGKYSFSS